MNLSRYRLPILASLALALATGCSSLTQRPIERAFREHISSGSPWEYVESIPLSNGRRLRAPGVIVYPEDSTSPITFYRLDRRGRLIPLYRFFNPGDGFVFVEEPDCNHPGL